MHLAAKQFYLHMPSYSLVVKYLRRMCMLFYATSLCELSQVISSQEMLQQHLSHQLKMPLTKIDLSISLCSFHAFM